MDDFPMIMEREAGMAEHIPMVGVGFGMNAIEDGEESLKAGRPIFKDVEFVRIQIPGDRESIVLQPATDIHRRRFPKAYEIFKRNAAIAEQGTPLEQWPAMTRALALTLKAAGIPTVEAMSEVHDGNLEKLGFNARDWREKARAYLKHAKESAAAQELALQNQKLQDTIAMMQEQIRMLAEAKGVDLEKLQGNPEPQKRKPGRPRKNEQAAA